MVSIIRWTQKRHLAWLVRAVFLTSRRETTTLEYLSYFAKSRLWTIDINHIEFKWKVKVIQPLKTAKYIVPNPNCRERKKTWPKVSNSNNNNILIVQYGRCLTWGSSQQVLASNRFGRRRHRRRERIGELIFNWEIEFWLSYIISLLAPHPVFTQLLCDAKTKTPFHPGT